MAANLNLKLKVITNNSCDGFFASDITPLWDSVSAPYGYDESTTSAGTAVDPADLDLTQLNISVTLPDGTITVITVPEASFDTSSIGTTGAFTYEITSTALGITGDLEDGIYLFEYTVTDNIGIFKAACVIVQDCNVCCCLNKKLIDINNCVTCTKDQRTRKIDDIYNAWMLMNKAKHLAACNDITGAQEILDLLNDYCDRARCDSC